MDKDASIQSTTPAQPEDAAALRELAVRLLRVRFPGDPEASDETQLLVGELPAGLPLELPLPPGSRVVGSLVRGNQRGISIVLDASEPAEQVLEFYRARLSAAGWRSPELPHHGGGGFTPDFMANRVTYCYSARGPALNVAAESAPGKPTDVQLDLQTDPRYLPCGARARHMGDMHDMIPTLAPPPGARQTPQGGGGGGDSWHSQAILLTELDLAAVAAHYAGQLTGAGWTQGANGESGPAAWSAWSLRDEDGEPWHGLLFILKQPEAEGQYYLIIRVELDASESGQGPSWVSTHGTMARW